MDGMQDTDGTHVILGPSRRFRYWPVSVLFVGAGFWVLWIAGLPDLMGDIGEPYWFARLRAKILIAFVPFLGAILMLFVPFRRMRLAVTPVGLEAASPGGGHETRIGWADLERVVYRRPRAIGCLEFRFRPGHGRRLWRLRDDCYDGGPVALLTAIRNLAPHGGFDLKGHRLDIAHWGGEEWRLEPRDAPAP
jgi:hypothetical protein